MAPPASWTPATHARHAARVPGAIRAHARHDEPVPEPEAANPERLE
jgi:hypothetical protein